MRELSIRKKKRSMRFEPLEVKRLLAADGARLVSDSFEVEQNSRDHGFDVLSNDRFDEDYAGAKAITDVSLGSAGGRISIAEDGKSVLYDPPADFSGRETFNYFVDGDHSGRVSVNVVSPLRDDSFSFDPDRMSWELDVLENDPFWEGYEGDGKISLVSASSFGATVEITEDGTAITYTRPEHRYFTDTLTYIVDDKYPATATITIDSPVVSDRYQLEQFDEPVTARVLSNDPFWRSYTGERRITHVLDVPEGVSVSIAEDGKAFVFDPQDVEPRSYGLRYVVDSEFEGYATFSVERPVRDDWITVDRNSTNFDIEVLQNDFYYRFNGNGRVFAQTVTAVTQSDQGGTVSIGEDGRSVVYTPPADYVGNDQFTYTADGKHVATVSVNVRNPLDEEPGRSDSFSIVVGSIDNRLDVLANDFSGNGYEGNRVITSITPVEGGDLRIGAGGKSLLFTPNEFDASELNFASYPFQYVVDDAITVDAWVGVRSVATPLYFHDIRTSTTTVDVVARLAIPAAYAGEGVITSVTQPENGGSVRISANGRSVVVERGIGPSTFEYTIDGKYSSTVHVNYPQRLRSDYFVVHQNDEATELDVLANDFPAWTEDRYGRYGGPRLITQVESETGNGTVAIADGGESISFEPNTDFVGQERITYVVDDLFEVTSTIDVARLLRHDTVHVGADSTGEVLNLLGNDLVGGDHGGALQITDVSPGSAGATITVAADGKSVTYTPAAGFKGTDSFIYTVDDKLKATVTVNVSSSSSELYPKFGSLDAFRDLVLESARNAHSFDNPVAEDGLDAEFGVSPPPSREHSETNVQVEGVDEADLIETDSDYIYTLTHGQAVITRAWPADDMEVVSRTDIKGSPIGQYLHGDRLTVISQEITYFDRFGPEDGLIDRGGIAFDSIWPPFPQADPITYVTVLDVTDRANPKLVQRTEVEGNHVQTRRIEDYVYLVVRDAESLVPQRQLICEEGDETECKFETDEEFQHRLENDFGSVLEDLLPRYESYGPDDTLVRTGLLIQPEDIFEPVSPGASSMVTVAAIDVTNDEPGLASATGVLTTGGSQLYVTIDNLYVFEQHYSWQYEDDLQDSPTTKIMKFSLDSESGGVDFAATGQVPGSFLNQFSADEYDGHLRIATAVSNNRSGNFSGENENALFVLKDDGGILEPVGTLQNLALNESIRSVRFFGERALVTTYQTIDPLFSIDLSEPTAPSVEGFFTLPGFSSYMQFIDAEHAITIGRNTGGRGAGVTMISLFDVSDILQPALIDQFNWTGRSSSVAETDHHAFGWFSIHDTLAIPSQVSYTTRSDEDGDGYEEHVNHHTDYTLHAFGIDTSVDGRNDGGIVLNGDVPMDSPLLRSAFIGDKLYAVAEDSIKSTEIAAPNDVIMEVDISRPEEEETPPQADPRLPVIDDLVQRARLDLAGAMNVRDEEITWVTTEALNNRTQLQLRVGDEHFVYHGLDDQVLLERSESRPLQTTTRFDWHNDANPLDVSGDGIVSPRDALLGINMINAGHVGTLPVGTVVGQIDGPTDIAKVDTNGDGQLTARDILLIINELNKPSPAPVDAVFAAAFIDADDDE